MVGDKYAKNDNEELTVIDAEKHLAWKEHHQRLLNEVFSWDKEGLVVDENDKGSGRSALKKNKRKASGNEETWSGCQRERKTV